ncbi:hypothetical protein FHG87_004686 [Trinorchestia longiramus]|nr:hypothetical protein FHG87_004686 [Trinorchestia longiramus]
MMPLILDNGSSAQVAVESRLHDAGEWIVSGPAAAATRYMDGQSVSCNPRTPGATPRSGGPAYRDMNLNGGSQQPQLPGARYLKRSPSGGLGDTVGLDSDSEEDYALNDERLTQQQQQHGAAAAKRARKSKDHGSSMRGGLTPVTSPGDVDSEYNRCGGPQYANPNLLPPEYYSNSYANSTSDQFDARRPNPRRIPTSVSSSDNNSDTTYAESGDINSSLRARMQALDNQLVGSPEMLPSDVLQRISPHHLLMEMRPGGGTAGDGPEGPPPNPPYPPPTPEDGYQQPQNTVFLSHEYLMAGNGVRYPGPRGGAKSPGGQALYCTPSPTRDYYSHNNAQQPSQEFYYYQQVHPHQPHDNLHRKADHPLRFFKSNYLGITSVSPSAHSQNLFSNSLKLPSHPTSACQPHSCGLLCKPFHF